MARASWDLRAAAALGGACVPVCAPSCTFLCAVGQRVARASVRCGVFPWGRSLTPFGACTREERGEIADVRLLDTLCGDRLRSKRYATSRTRSTAIRV